MPPLPNVNALKIVNFHEVAGTTRQWINVMHLDYGATPPDETQISALASNWDGPYDTAFTDFCHTSDEHTSTFFEDLSSDTGVVATTEPLTHGGSSGSLAPLSVCAVASWSIFRRYRGGKPRTYLSALTDAQAPGPSNLDSTFASNWENALITFLNFWTNKTISGITYNLACVSYRTGNAQRVTPLVEDIINVTVHPEIRTQRRRLANTA